ncbi:unnamed protein product [Rangifer tarandus platyrhynchus]|uniref:Uncharacterized protein n=2 Tax=Rangifer tarandus platyrhynchus TaxID=3082113 RepID=A0ACB0ER65_RANTA|nr:unnamed protein product [Rangifer tarandus platyrhynchus]CAI9703262.1 unnamed protein product [Rangifer tarandus platyrhynchus]
MERRKVIDFVWGCGAPNTSCGELQPGLEVKRNLIAARVSFHRPAPGRRGEGRGREGFRHPAEGPSAHSPPLPPHRASAPPTVLVDDPEPQARIHQASYSSHSHPGLLSHVHPAGSLPPASPARTRVRTHSASQTGTNPHPASAHHTGRSIVGIEQRPSPRACLPPPRPPSHPSPIPSATEASKATWPLEVLLRATQIAGGPGAGVQPGRSR